MGLWNIQEVSRNLNGKYSFSELVELAKADPYPYTFDVNKAKFLHPENMIETIQEELMNQGIEPPRQVGQIADCVYRSLAEAVKTAVNQLEQLTEKQFETINIIGGGCQNEYLNELIAKETNKSVIAGPIEATAIGNLISQMIDVQETETIDRLLNQSFEYKTYEGGTVHDKL